MRPVPILLRQEGSGGAEPGFLLEYGKSVLILLEKKEVLSYEELEKCIKRFEQEIGRSAGSRKRGESW